ncbi:MAG: hypothetical protein K5768_08590 [Firmicutes bacterium]|nr:hypothetical protein [Bacillota bacterium]
MNSPYQKLAWAIILKAVKDYRKAMKDDNRKTKRECERFFRSGWFQKLTTIDGEMMIQKLRAEVTV